MHEEQLMEIIDRVPLVQIFEQDKELVWYYRYSRTSLFRTRLIRNPRNFEVKLIPFHLTVAWCQLGYFETPLFRTYFHVPWDFEIVGFDCTMNYVGTRIPLTYQVSHFTPSHTLP